MALAAGKAGITKYTSSSFCGLIGPGVLVVCFGTVPEPRLSRHAQDEIVRRAIPLAWIEAALEHPEQRVEEGIGKEIWQSRFTTEDGRMYLLRIVMAVDREPPLVVTVYRTSKIAKYWRAE